MRIPHLKIQEILLQKLLLLGFREAKAEMLSKTFMESSLDGVYSHGLNRFPRFHKNVKQGYVHPNAEPEKISSSANLEQWDGNLGPGPAYPLGAGIILPGHQPSMPSQQSLRCDNTGDLLELPELDLLGLTGQSSSLLIGEAQALGSEMLSQHSNLLPQVFNHVLLIAVHPAGQTNQ